MRYKYHYRAVDHHGEANDFVLTVKRDTKAALHDLRQVVAPMESPV